MHPYLAFLSREMLPAFGCTEPIALAYAACEARAVLAAEPVRLLVRCSGNLIKNAKSVFVPNANGRRGIAISAALGAMCSEPERKLQVLEEITPKQRKRAEMLVDQGACCVQHDAEKEGLYIDLTLWDAEEHWGRVILSGEHTNIVWKERDGKVLYQKTTQQEASIYPSFTFAEIYSFAKEADYSPIRPLFDQEITYNLAIGTEGLTHDWGCGIGKAILREGTAMAVEIAYAVAGSDARMSGCKLPVVINSGSGNQGMTVSLPIIRHAEHVHADEDKRYRSLLFANLLAAYQKAYIGRLSAYCGAVSAAAASVAGIAFMDDAPQEVIAETIINSLATSAGVVCDGAKPSCAAKIALALRTSYIAYEQAKEGRSFSVGDGLVASDVDATIRSIGRVAREGMAETDRVILQEMMETGKNV